jgi:hypothetical protein
MALFLGPTKLVPVALVLGAVYAVIAHPGALATDS